MPDRFVWKWTADGSYTASSAYRSFFLGMTSMAGAKQVWRATVPPKVKLFYCLLARSSWQIVDG